MSMPTYLLGFVTLGLVYFFLFRRCNHTSIKKIDQRTNGVNILSQLRYLLQALQQHRGMAGAYLSGDDAFKSPLLKKQQEIDGLIRGLTENMNIILHHNSFWNDVETGWAETKLQLEILTSSQSFMHHSRVIQRLLDVMEEFGDTVNLTTVDDRMQRDLSELIVTKLPGLTERLGQARALGASAAVEGMVSTVVGMRLTFLSSQIMESLTQINTVLNAVNNGNTVEMVHGLSNSIKAFLSTLDNELIRTKIPSIHSDDYFKLATATIDEVYAVYDRLSPMLADTLQHQTSRLHRRQRWVSVFIGSALAGMSSLVFAQWWP